MANIKIKSLGERVSTSGLHMGGGHERRKLEPGEVVEIPEGFEAGQYEGNDLLTALVATDKVELTIDPVTRPLDFADANEAKLTSPTYKSRGPDEDVEIQKAREAVAARLARASLTQPPAESPVKTQPPAGNDDTPADSLPEPPGVNRRAARRAAAQAAQSGAETTT